MMKRKRNITEEEDEREDEDEEEEKWTAYVTYVAYLYYIFDDLERIIWLEKHPVYWLYNELSCRSFAENAMYSKGICMAMHAGQLNSRWENLSY